MAKYVCRNCGKTYEYCRGCSLSPIIHKMQGYCSKTCQEEAQNQKIEEVIRKDVEVVIEHEDIPTSEEEIVECPHFFAEIELEEENETDDNEQDYREDV